MVLGKMVTQESGGVGCFQQAQPLFVQLLQRCLAPVDPIEQSKFYLLHIRLPPTLLMILFLCPFQPLPVRMVLSARHHSKRTSRLEIR